MTLPPALEVRVPVATVWTGPEAPRDRDRPAVMDDPDVSAWTAAMDASARTGLNGRTLTQLLMGEPVRVVEEGSDWVRVRAPWQPSSLDKSGYPGWVRREHLASPVAPGDLGTVVVTAPRAPCRLGSGATVHVSFGTRLRAEVPHPGGDTGAVSVLLPGEGRGTLRLSDVRLVHERQPQAFGSDEILGSARQFLGLRYLWGGTSAWGLDCSGLVHLAYRAHGVVVPRDAFDQADGCEPVPLADVRPGDLYFFARPGERIYHVGFVTRPVAGDDTRWMLHAPEGDELVEDAPLAPHRSETLVSAGRVR